MVVDIRRRLTRDQRPMAIFQLEDFRGSVEVVAYPEIFEAFGNLILMDAILIVEGRVAVEEEEGEVRASVIAERIMRAREVEKKAPAIQIRLSPDSDRTLLQRLRQIIASHPGSAPVFFVVKGTDGGTTKIKSNVTANPSSELVAEVERILGPGSISVG